jgi:hypothetical protein
MAQRGDGTAERVMVVAAETTAVVAAQLELLVGLDPHWALVPTGGDGAAGDVGDPGKGDDGLDRLLVGPAGAYLVQARRLAGARVYVQGDSLWVDGEAHPGLDRCRAAADRALGSLARATGWQEPVTGVLVPLDVRELAVAVQPARARVLARPRLVPWLTAQTGRAAPSRPARPALP